MRQREQQRTSKKLFKRNLRIVFQKIINYFYSVLKKFCIYFLLLQKKDSKKLVEGKIVFNIEFHFCVHTILIHSIPSNFNSFPNEKKNFLVLRLKDSE